MVFARAYKAQKSRNEAAKIVAWIYVAVLVVMFVGQLVAFQDFIPLIDSTYVANHVYGAATLMACLLVFGEVFAVPFLLRMTLSPLMRYFSALCGVAVAFMWAKNVVFPIDGTLVGANSGLLGTDVTVPIGAAATIIGITLLGLAAYSTWGLWPSHKK